MAEEPVTEVAAPAAEANPLQSDLDAAKAENDRLKLEWEQAQHVNQRQRGEIDSARRNFETYKSQLADAGYKEPEQSQEAVLKDRLDRQNEEMGMMRYKLENPGWKDHWGEMQKIFNDPTRAEEIAVFDRDGQPNMYKSMVNAQTRVEIEQLRALKSETEAAKATRASEQDRLKGQATISGVPASEGEETVNVDDMSSDDMIRAGLIDMDSRDPVKERNPK